MYQNMFPTAVDQNRQENGHPQLVHFYMHCCPCSGILYNTYTSAGYRPHFVAYQPRPYNLHHYQYTQYNMSPYNLPIAPTTVVTPNSFTSTPSPHQNAPSMDLPFGPPPRDRRNLERPETDITSEDLHENHIDFAAGNEKHLSQSPPQLNAQTSFLKFLESSCLAADQIAYRNRNRPCFRNIQNLCIRTRNEILKPSTTISNIHSQGIPWATKDFIYAFIRLTNCWQILKGYLENKEGNLGKIEKELTPEFKACYAKWEKDSMELADHLTRIFCNLDNNISNPNNAACGIPNPQQSLSHISLLRSNSAQSSPKTCQQNDNLTAASTTTTVTPQTSKETLKGVRGIIHIPQVTTPSDMAEAISSSDHSPREDDSDNEGRVYMKPGSYNVPKKNHSMDNSPRSIEFLETAQNVGAHRKSKIFEIPIEKLTNIQLNATMENNGGVRDDIWMGTDHSETTIRNLLNITEENDQDVQTWINNSAFDIQTTPEDYQEKDLQHMSYFSKPVSLLQRPKQSEDLNRDHFFVQKSSKCGNGHAMQEPYLDLGCFRSSPIGNKIQSRTYRKRCDAANEKTSPKFYSYKKNTICCYEQKHDNLSDTCVSQCEEIVNQLKATELCLRLSAERCKKEAELEDNYKNPINWDVVSIKLKNGSYRNLSEIIHDFRHIVNHMRTVFQNQSDIMKEITTFSRQIDAALAENFPNFDFSHITGQPDEELATAAAQAQYKKQKKLLLADGDGDH